MEHHELLLDLGRKSAAPAASIDQKVTDVFGGRLRVRPALGQRIRDARNGSGKTVGSRVRRQFEDPVDRATVDRMIGRLRGAPPAVPAGLTELARRFETGRKLIERPPRRSEVSGLECQRIAERRILGGIFHSPRNTKSKAPFTYPE